MTDTIRSPLERIRDHVQSEVDAQTPDIDCAELYAAAVSALALLDACTLRTSFAAIGYRSPPVRLVPDPWPVPVASSRLDEGVAPDSSLD